MSDLLLLLFWCACCLLPPSGYMFGKGVYFADMVSKSANCQFRAQLQADSCIMRPPVVGHSLIGSLLVLFCVPPLSLSRLQCEPRLQHCMHVAVRSCVG